MDYTLDSVTHVIRALENKHRGKTVEKNSIYIDDLSEIKKTSNKYYFGVLTIAKDVETAELQNSSDIEIITIQKNSQIIEIFNNVVFKDSGNVIIPSPKGHFRGFEIYVK